MSGEPESQRYLLNQLSFLLDGIKGLNGQIARQVQAMDRYDTEFAKLRIDIGGMKSELGQVRIDLNQFRSSTELQTEAILRRLDVWTAPCMTALIIFVNCGPMGCATIVM